jgi:hypothetical protein
MEYFRFPRLLATPCTCTARGIHFSFFARLQVLGHAGLAEFVLTKDALSFCGYSWQT